MMLKLLTADRKIEYKKEEKMVSDVYLLVTLTADRKIAGPPSIGAAGSLSAFFRC